VSVKVAFLVTGHYRKSTFSTSLHVHITAG